ncbi:MAG: HNH endonuclease [Thermoplasmata archaeon]
MPSTPGRYIVQVGNEWAWDLVKLLLNRVERHGDCWIFTGTPSERYGKLRWEGTMFYAHRLTYELLRGPIPPKHDLHHDCKHHRCLNPAHMTPLTRSAHTALEGNVYPYREKAWAHERSVTHCPHGHPYDESNTYRDRRGRRSCRVCRRRWRKPVMREAPHATDTR